jgi:hypothetical protein
MQTRAKALAGNGPGNSLARPALVVVLAAGAAAGWSAMAPWQVLPIDPEPEGLAPPASSADRIPLPAPRFASAQPQGEPAPPLVQARPALPHRAAPRRIHGTLDAPADGALIRLELPPARPAETFAPGSPVLHITLPPPSAAALPPPPPHEAPAIALPVEPPLAPPVEDETAPVPSAGLPHEKVSTAGDGNRADPSQDVPAGPEQAQPSVIDSAFAGLEPQPLADSQLANTGPLRQVEGQAPADAPTRNAAAATEPETTAPAETLRVGAATDRHPLVEINGTVRGELAIHATASGEIGFRLGEFASLFRPQMEAIGQATALGAPDRGELVTFAQLRAAGIRVDLDADAGRVWFDATA